MSPSTALAAVLVDELVRGGVREAVLAPGSRSAPLALALHDADVAGRLRLHVRIDERSAGFVALGLAKASGRPVPVATTSGTAAANLHPAVLEASYAGVALVALTADRPSELRETGANQTVDQLKLYGDAVRFFAEVGAPVGAAGEAGYWRALTARALAAASGALTRDPGPVHLNLAFRDPLVPAPAIDHGAPDVATDGRADGGPWTTLVAPPARRPVDDLPPRTLVVVGDAPPAMGREALLLAEARGWPVLSEPSGNARSGPNALTAGPALLELPGFVAAHFPDRLLVVGRPTLSRSVIGLMSDLPFDVVTASARWSDPARGARRVLAAVPELGSHDRDVDDAWLPEWRVSDQAARAAIDGVLDASPVLLEPRIAREVATTVPADALLVAGSSAPVRDLYAAAPAREGVTVLANRGASGIDGTVSTAVGAALAWQVGGGGPAYALVGDLTFLHDGNGLVLGPVEPRPDLTIVVVNNDGGGLFAVLEPGEPAYAGAFERVFGTPHGTDLGVLCASTGTPHCVVADAAALRAALCPRPGPAAGVRVVEARTDRTAARAVAARLREAVGAAVAAAVDGSS